MFMIISIVQIKTFVYTYYNLTVSVVLLIGELIKINSLEMNIKIRKFKEVYLQAKYRLLSVVFVYRSKIHVHGADCDQKIP